MIAEAKTRDRLGLSGAWRVRLVAMACAIALVAAACGDDSDTSASTDSAPTTRADTSAPPSSADDGDDVTSETTDPDALGETAIATFNAGLAEGFVDHASARAPLVYDAVAGLDAQVVFVQEVWTEADVAALTEAAAGTLPHSSFLDPMPDEVGTDEAGEVAVACPLNEAVPLEECARQRCADVPADELANCVLTDCGVEYSEACPECQACLAANVGSTIDEAMEACTQGSAAYAYEGAFGIGFLSAEPFTAQDSLVLDSSLTRRAVLYAQVDDPVLGAVHLFGTHLSPVFTDVPFPGDGTWEDEQLAQIETVRSWIDEKTGGEGTIVLLGDFNTGPATALSEGEVEDNYNALAAGGWRNAFVDTRGDEAECTYCTANPLVSGTGESGVLIDHVLVLGHDGTLVAERILDGEVEIEVDGGVIPTAVSDHFGVRAVLAP